MLLLSEVRISEAALSILPLSCWDCGFESRWAWIFSLSCESLVLLGRGLFVADQSSRTVLPNVVYLSVIMKPRQRGSPGPIAAVEAQKNCSIDRYA